MTYRNDTSLNSLREGNGSSRLRISRSRPSQSQRVCASPISARRVFSCEESISKTKKFRLRYADEGLESLLSDSESVNTLSDLASDDVEFLVSGGFGDSIVD
jgi:hypothetical protein